MPSRNLKFYTELVIVTVLSLVAAHAWTRLIKRILSLYFPDTPFVDLIYALVVTGIAIFILNWAFAKDEKKLEKKLEGDDDEVAGPFGIISKESGNVEAKLRPEIYSFK